MFRSHSFAFLATNVFFYVFFLLVAEDSMRSRSASQDALVETIPSCISADQPALYDPIVLWMRGELVGWLLRWGAVVCRVAVGDVGGPEIRRKLQFEVP